MAGLALATRRRSSSSRRIDCVDASTGAHMASRPAGCILNRPAPAPVFRGPTHHRAKPCDQIASTGATRGPDPWRASTVSIGELRHLTRRLDPEPVIRPQFGVASRPMARRRRFRFDLENVDHYEIIPELGSIGGANEKDVIRDPETGAVYIAKLGRRHNDLEVMTEFAIYIIGRSLSVEVAEAKIAKFHGQLRFLSRYFLQTDPPEELVHGMQLFHQLYDESTVKDIVGKTDEEQSLFSVQSVKAAFGAHYVKPEIEDALFAGFVAMLAHDALIGVQDRHHENWGVIVRRDVDAPSPRFAPLYDSARGLFCNEPDRQLKAYLHPVSGSERLDGFIGRSRPLVGFDGLRPVQRRRYITHVQLLAAVHGAFPTYRKPIDDVLASYDWKRVRAGLTQELGPLCSPTRKTLILHCLRRRLKALRKAIDGVKS